MLHTWSSENKFFERPADPGTPVNGVYPDVPAPERPAAGTIIKVQDGDGNPLPDLTLGAGGLWSYSFDSDEATFAIQLSEDGGTNWSPSLWSDQSMFNMANSGELAAQASVDAAEAKALAGTSGAKSVNGVTPDGTGDVELTPAVIGAVGKGELVVNVKDFGAKGDGVTDDAAAINSALLSGASALLSPGAYSIGSPINVPAGAEVRLSAGAVILNTVATQSAVTLAAGATLRGGKITSPAVFDATTGGAWSYAVVYVTGDGASVEGVSLDNVPRIGIGVKGDNVRVVGNRVTGNFPAASWTGTETSHFGIALDASGSTTDGNLVVSGNIVQSCVQGVFLGNFSIGSGRGVAITGNVFYGCHNHGVYATSGTAHTVVGNSFNQCQKPIVVDGVGHVVANNTLWTSSSGGNLDKTGIGVRNATDCVIEGNTIAGDNTTDNLAISLDNTSGNTLARNIVRGNTINLAGTDSGFAAIRLGNSATTEVCEDNQVVGNIIRTSGATGTSNGVIEVANKVGFMGTGNIVAGNTLAVTGNSHHIVLTRQRCAQVRDNHLRNEYDATVTTTIIQVRLFGVTDSAIVGNVLANPSTRGSNVAIQGIRENDALCDRNILGPNLCRWDGTNLISGTEIVQSNSANASLIGVRVGEYATATTLGALTGKVEIRDSKGSVKGYAPVYGSIA